MPCSRPSCVGPRGRPQSTTGRSTEPPITQVGAEADICQGLGISRHDGEHRRDHRRPPRTTSVTFYRAGSWSHGEYKRKCEPAPCRGTIRAVATRAETGLSRQEATLGRRPPRQPRGAPRKARTCRRTKITVRSFVSPRCHDHPEWTSNNHDTQSRGRTAAIMRITEGTPGHRRLHEALRIPEDLQPHSPTYRKNGHDHRQLGKPYARSGKNACRGDPEAFTAGNEKGQLSWPFTKSG